MTATERPCPFPGLPFPDHSVGKTTGAKRVFIIYILVLKIPELQDWVDGSVRALAKAWGPEFRSPDSSTCVCNPKDLSTGKRDRWVPGSLWLVSLSQTASFRFNERPCFKGIRQRIVEKNIQCKGWGREGGGEGEI